MQIITIECITKNEIKISINGEKLTGITAFSLEMKAGETEKYYIEKHIPPPKQQEVPLNNNTTNGQITRWWTIPKVIEVLKKRTLIPLFVTAVLEGWCAMSLFPVETVEK